MESFLGRMKSCISLRPKDRRPTLELQVHADASKKQSRCCDFNSTATNLGDCESEFMWLETFWRGAWSQMRNRAVFRKGFYFRFSYLHSVIPPGNSTLDGLLLAILSILGVRCPRTVPGELADSAHTHTVSHANAILFSSLMPCTRIERVSLFP